MGIRLRFSDDPFGWAYHDDVTGAAPPLHFTPIGPATVVYWPAPRPVVFPTPGVAMTAGVDRTPVGRDPSDPSTWGARGFAPATGMVGRLNGSGEGP